MKRSFTLFSIFLFSAAMAQTPEMISGVTVNNSKQLPLLNIIGQVNNETFVLRGKETNETIEMELSLFGSDLTIISQNEFSLPVATNEKWFYLGSTIINDVPWLFVSHFSLDKKKHHAVAIPLSEKGIDIENKKSLEIIPSFSSNNPGNFKVELSLDKNYILLFRENPSDKTKNETFAVTVFDNKFNQLWHKDHTTDIVSKTNLFNQPLITNDGTVFIVKKDRDKTQFKFSAFFIDNTSHSVSTKPISVTPKIITDIKASVNADHQLVLFGFYSTIDYSFYEGLFCFAFDRSGNQVIKHLENLNSDLKSNFMSKKEADKGDVELSGFTLEHIVPLSEGGFYALSEKTHQVTEKEGEHYSYGDIMIIAMDKNGNMKWGKGVKKNQQSMNDNAKWSSFNYFVYNDTLHLLYNKVIADPSLVKNGKLSKPDEFGDRSFAGTNWHWFAPDGVHAGAALTGMHKTNEIPMALNLEMVFVNEKMESFIMSEDYFDKKTRMISIIAPVTKATKEDVKEKGKVKY